MGQWGVITNSDKIGVRIVYEASIKDWKEILETLDGGKYEARSFSSEIRSMVNQIEKTVYPED